MQFNQKVLGANVRLSPDARSAERLCPGRSFCDALLFSAQPIGYGQPIRLHLKSSGKNGWRGSAVIGLCSRKPTSFLDQPTDQNDALVGNDLSPTDTTSLSLPSLTLPFGLCNRSHVWLRTVPVACLNRTFCLLLQQNGAGAQLLALLASEHQYILFSLLPVHCAFWLILDLFGQTFAVQLLPQPSAEQLQKRALKALCISTAKPNEVNATEADKTATDEKRSDNTEQKVTNDITSHQSNISTSSQTETNIVNPSINFKEETIDQLDDQLNERHIPSSVLACGPIALNSYAKACELGAVRYNCARLFLIGPSGAGKSVLRQQLVNSNEEDEKNNQNSISRCFSDSRGQWRVDSNSLHSTDLPDSPPAVEQRLNEDLAFNLARLLLLQRSTSESLNKMDANRLHQLTRVDPSDNDNEPTEAATTEVVSTTENTSSGNNFAGLLRGVLRFSFRPNHRQEDLQGQFDDIAQSEADESQENENQEEFFPPKLKEMVEDMLSRSQELLNNSTPEAEQVDPVAPNELCYEIWDMSGSFMYFMLNQTLLSPNALFLFVLDISQDLESPTPSSSSTQAEIHKTDLSPLRILHYWLGALYAQLYRLNNDDDPNKIDSSNGPLNSNGQVSSETLLKHPQVLLVATHRNSVHEEPLTRDATVEDIFTRIKNSLSDKPYAQLLHPQFFALDTNKLSFDEPKKFFELRLAVDRAVQQQQLASAAVPIGWLRLQRLVERLAARGVHFVAQTQLSELLSAQLETEEPLLNDAGLQAALQFLHSQGKLLCFGAAGVGGPLLTLTGNSNNLESVPFDWNLDRQRNWPNPGHSRPNHRNGNMMQDVRMVSYNDSLLVLQPNWLLNCFYRLCSFVLRIKQGNEEALISGVLREELLNKVWADRLEQKNILVGCLERLDLLCELRPCVGLEDPPDVASSILQTKVYIFPWITQIMPEAIHEIGLFYDVNGNNSLRLILNFNQFLPIGLYTRLVLRLSRWSWNQGWGRRPEICHSEARVAVDFDHDLILKINLQQNRISLIVIKIYDNLHNEILDGPASSGPTPNVCVKVRHLVESEMDYIQNQYYRRISWMLMAVCPCELQCVPHSKIACNEENCLHFLSLHECLSKKLVECDYRQVRTKFISRYFPQASFFAPDSPNNDPSLFTGQMINNAALLNPNGQSQTLAAVNSSSSGGGAISYLAHLFSGQHNSHPTPSMSATGPSNQLYDLLHGWDSIFTMEPSWMREAAKQLHMRSEPGRDWVALARRLGYSPRDTYRLKLEDEQYPALALLRDWFDSNGRTRYCIDILMSCLRMISREDVLQLLESELEPEGSAPPVFISYQSASQEAALHLRRRLELSGFPCWMDVGLLGGGDQLYTRIYDGLSRCKLVVCCLTARYCASRSCAREVTLADVLHKPILPIMLEPTPWPPPGPMALIMSSLVYVDLCGVGGHGGVGKRADHESRFREILDRVARYVAGYVDVPPLNRPMLLPDLFQQMQAPSQLSMSNGSSAIAGMSGDGMLTDRSDPPLSALYAARLSSANQLLYGQSTMLLEDTLDIEQEDNLSNDRTSGPSTQINNNRNENNQGNETNTEQPSSNQQHSEQTPNAETPSDQAQEQQSTTQNSQESGTSSASVEETQVSQSGSYSTDVNASRQTLSAMAPVTRTNNRIANCSVCIIC